MAINDVYGKSAPIPLESIGHTLRLSKLVNTVIGTAATLLTRPAGMKTLILSLETPAAAAANNFRLKVGDYMPKVFTAANATEIFTSATHGYETGDGPYKVSNSGGALPAGLTNTALYYIIKLSVNTFQLAANYADTGAAGATVVPVAISDDGTGTQTIGGVPVVAAATTTDGYASIGLFPEGPTTTTSTIFRISAPDKLTVQGIGATDILTYWWLPD